MGGTEGVRHREITYEPLHSHKLFHDSSARFRCLSGPIGSGKSQALCQEAIKLTYLNPGQMPLLEAAIYPLPLEPGGGPHTSAAKYFGRKPNQPRFTGSTVRTC
jgi:hypothetical protein